MKRLVPLLIIIFSMLTVYSAQTQTLSHYSKPSTDVVEPNRVALGEWFTFRVDLPDTAICWRVDLYIFWGLVFNYDPDHYQVHLLEPHDSTFNPIYPNQRDSTIFFSEPTYLEREGLYTAQAWCYLSPGWTGDTDSTNADFVYIEFIEVYLSSDSLIAKLSAQFATIGEIASETKDSLGGLIDTANDIKVSTDWIRNNPSAYHADISGLSTFDNTTDPVIVGTNNDKSGYSLIVQDWTTDADITALEAHGDANWITATGFSIFDHTTDPVIVGTNNDKTGYSLSIQDWTTDSDITALQNHGDENWGSTEIPDSLYTLLDSLYRVALGDSLAGLETAIPDSLYTLLDSLYRVAIGDSLSRLETTHGPGSWQGGDLSIPDSLYETIRESFAGLGPNACSLRVLSSADTTAISGCDLRIMNTDGTASTGLWYTDPNGLVVFNLMDGAYRAIPYLTGYQFTDSPYTIQVSGAVNDTIWGAPFSPSAPANPDLCNVYGFMADIDRADGEDVKIVIANDTNYLRSPEGRIIIGYRVEAAPDSTGYWEVPLYPNSVLEPTTSTYEFVFRIGRKEYKRDHVIVPDQDTWEFEWGE